MRILIGENKLRLNYQAVCVAFEYALNSNSLHVPDYIKVVSWKKFKDGSIELTLKEKE